MAYKPYTPIPQDKIGETFVWRDWLQKLSNAAFGNASTVDLPLIVGNGGTGQTSYIDGQILIGKTAGNTLVPSFLTAGTNISITNGSGSITISAAGVGFTPSVVTTSSVTYAATALSGYNVILANTVSNNINITLPTAVFNRAVFVIKKIDAGNTLTVTALGAQTIDGGTTAAWTVRYESISIVSDNTNWHIV